MNANLPRRAAMALFLHCSGSGPRQWQPITAALACHVDCVAPTLIGYGEGESWRGGQPLTLDDEVDHLAEHLYANPDGVHLVGHSYGAAIALQAALRHPHQVRSLTLYEPVRFSMLFGSPATAGAAQVVIALGRDMKRRILHGYGRHVSADNVHVVTPWADGSALRPSPRCENRLARELGLHETFNLVYSGKLGVAHDVDTLVVRGVAATS